MSQPAGSARSLSIDGLFDQFRRKPARTVWTVLTSYADGHQVKGDLSGFHCGQPTCHFHLHHCQTRPLATAPWSDDERSDQEIPFLGTGMYAMPTMTGYMLYGAEIAATSDGEAHDGARADEEGLSFEIIVTEAARIPNAVRDGRSFVGLPTPASSPA